MVDESGIINIIYDWPPAYDVQSKVLAQDKCAYNAK